MPSLFELKDDDTIDMSTIITKMQDMLPKRRFLISKLEKFVSTFTFTSHKCQKLGHIFCFEGRKNIQTARSNVDACPQKYSE